MPPFKTVPALKAIGRDKVLFKVCEIIIEEIFFSADQDWEAFGPPMLSVRLQMARDVLVNALNPNILEDILNVILEKDTDIEPTVRYVALQLLLVKGVISLSVGHFPESYYSHVLEAITESCAELKKLDLQGLWVKGKDKLALCKLIRRLNNARHLIMKYVCDDELLVIIGKHCHNLERLDISGSHNITEEGIRQFIENPTKTVHGVKSDICESLQILDFGGPGAQKLPPVLGSRILLDFPNLKSLGSFDKTGQAVEVIHNDTSTSDHKTFDLRYIHDVRTTSRILSAVAKLCPNLQAAYLDTPGSTAVQHLHMLKKLTEIKLHKVKLDDLKVLLTNCGEKLRSFFLLTVFGPINFMELGALCPNLVRLELHFVSLLCSDTSHPTALKKLKELHLFNSQITTTSAKLIINQCEAIEVLSLGDCAQLTDAAVISSLMDNSLKKLRTIWFGLAENLTKRTVDALIEHCPNLTSLGNLAAWSVSSEEIAVLRVQLFTSNLDLELHEYGPEEDIPFV